MSEPIIWRAIELEQSIARGVAVSAIDSIIPTAAPVDGMTIVTLMLMFVFGVRLWCKLASNVVHVCVAIIWSPVALVCGLIPESSWVAGVWVREFTGRLAGAVLATIATAVGLALALGHPGLLATAGGVAGFMAAHDLVDWLARTPGSHMGGILGMGLRLAAVGSGGGAAGAAAQAAAMRAFDRSEQARATQAFYGFD